MSESEESKNERSLVQVLDLSQWGRSKQWASKASEGKMSRITILINEAPPRVSENKETHPLTFREHGNTRKFCWENGNMDPPGRPSSTPLILEPGTGHATVSAVW